MKLTNLYGLPEPIYQAIKNDSYRGGGDISVTTLIKPPRMRLLTKRHADKITEDASDKLWSLLGQAIHYILERSETDGHIKEHRIAKEINGRILTGQFDLLRLAGAKLSDHKATSVYKFKKNDLTEWEQQLNLLRWLCVGGYVWNPDGLPGIPPHGTVVNYDINELEINAILRDWKRGEQRIAERNGEFYPKIPFQQVKIPLWSLERAGDFAHERMRIHMEAEAYDDANLPQCSKDERWAKDSAWAFRKPGTKRAVRGGVFYTEAEADAFAKNNPGLEREFRPGVNTRCEDYCLAKNFCNQYALMRAQED